MLKIAVVSLGCNKNLVDSEMLLGLLLKRGYEITDAEEDADMIIINTCAFIHDAKKESVNKIIEVGLLKEKKLKWLLVTGCLAKRYESEIKKELPEVDLVFGINDYEMVLDFIDEKTGIIGIDSKIRKIEFGERARSTPPHSAYVKIADGCDNFCTYCVIPKIRGRYKSRTIEDIENEVKTISQEGVTEIILTAQDTTYYGMDIYGERRLSELILRLNKIEGIHWIRFQYAYPEGITDELLDVVFKTKKVCKYFDIPVQHGNDEILKKMGRKTSKNEILALIKKIRNKMPDSVIRTSLIVGFPGETEAQFEELKNFVMEVKFDKLGVFTYSKEEGTQAAKLKNQVRAGIKKQRQKEIMMIQQKISLEKNKSKVGRNIEVLVEGKLPSGTFFGRTRGDAPEIDGFAFIETERELELGEYYNVAVFNAKEYDILCKLN